MVRCHAISENTARNPMPITVNCHATAHQTHFNPKIALLACSSQQLCAQVAWYPNAFVSIYKAVKESRNRPGVAQRVPGDLGSQISWHSAREGGEVVILTHRPPLPPGMFLVLIFTRGWVDPRAGRKYVTEKSTGTTGNRPRNRPTSSAAP
jgi:hypothetical protein